MKRMLALLLAALLLFASCANGTDTSGENGYKGLLFSLGAIRYMG